MGCINENVFRCSFTHQPWLVAEFWRWCGGLDSLAIPGQTLCIHHCSWNSFHSMPADLSSPLLSLFCSIKHWLGVVGVLIAACSLPGTSQHFHQTGLDWGWPELQGTEKAGCNVEHWDTVQCLRSCWACCQSLGWGRIDLTFLSFNQEYRYRISEVVDD